MACRFATWPVSRSPAFEKATTEGTVRPPSALGPPDARLIGSLGRLFVRERLVLARIERPPGGLDRRHALRLEQEAKLAVDGRDALDPGQLRQLGGHGLDGTVEIIHDRQDLARP